MLKPKLFPSKNHLTKRPGPCSYSIPERSIYARPGAEQRQWKCSRGILLGKTIGSRFDDVPLASTSLLARYYPDIHHLPRAHMPFISVTPRRTKPDRQRDSLGGFSLLSEPSRHCQTPLLRPSHGSTVARGSRSLSISPGPAAYPMFEFDEDILPRPQHGVTQKHRLSFDGNARIFPPFYYPQKLDLCSSPAFSIGQRLHHSARISSCTAPYSAPIDNRGGCSRALRPGVTLKGRWSSSLYMGPTAKAACR